MFECINSLGVFRVFTGAPYSEMQKDYNTAVVALNKLIYANNLSRDVGIIHLNQSIIIHRDGEPMFKFDNLVNGFMPNQFLKQMWKGELLDSMKLNTKVNTDFVNRVEMNRSMLDIRMF